MIETGKQQNQSEKTLLQSIKTAPIPNDLSHAEDVLETFKNELSAKEDYDQFLTDLQSNAGLKELLLGIFGNSPFLTGLITRNPAALRDALYTPSEQRLFELEEILSKQISEATSMDMAMKALRQYKTQACLFTALTDLSKCWDVPRVIEAITISADTALKYSARYLFTLAMNKGEIFPKNKNAPEMDSGYIILAMGKQGAYELNYSSDVDLIIFYDTHRLTLKDGIEPSTYFVRLTRNLVKLMHERTADGYVFRVDLRLRPDPGATQIALSTDAAYSYYESFGQNWERAAMIKARPVAGDIIAGIELLNGLAPFIWRKYLDFAAIDDIHAMKRQIHAIKGHGKITIAGHNIKLGRGGIREIEFFAQTQQLISGGRQPELRTTKTLETLDNLAENNWIEQSAAEEMAEAYKYLRFIEHRIQMVADEQTHSLPEKEDALLRIANFAGYQTLQEFSDELRHRLETVQKHYAELFEDDPSLSSSCGNLVFAGDNPDPDTIKTFEKLGFKDPIRTLETVKSWHYGRYASTRSERSRERITEFQPLLIEALSKTEQPDMALATFDKFLKELPAGVQLFSLLSSNQNLLRLIAEIMGTAPGLAHVLSRRTRVLDAVLDPGFFGNLPDDHDLTKLIEDEFIECIDYQDTLDKARIVGQEQAFLIGVRLLSGIISADEAASGYTLLADMLIQKLQAKVEEEMREAHGTFENAAVTVLAMGKLGGVEMTATSDVDIILIYDTPATERTSDESTTPALLFSNGKKPLSATQYYSRFTQRLIAAISAPTSEGALYEVDMRLRPSGRSGPVATQVESFIEYQNKEAWVWEHLALTRARCISGADQLQQRLNQTIKEVLSKQRNKTDLANEVRNIREKIAAEKGTENIWDIKQVRGGQVDLEFICQYLQLLHGHTHPEIIDTKTAQCLEKIAQTEILPEDQINQLYEAANFYNRLIQIIRLCTEKSFIPEAASLGLKKKLASGVGLNDFDELTEKLKETQSGIKHIFENMFL